MSIVIARGLVNQIEVFFRRSERILGGESEYRTDFRDLVRGEVKIVAVAADLEPSHDRLADANLILREARTMVDVARDVVKKREDKINALACSAIAYGLLALARWASSATPVDPEDGWVRRAKLIEITD